MKKLSLKVKFQGEEMGHAASLEFLVLEGMSIYMIVGLFTELKSVTVPGGDLKLLSNGDLDFCPGDLRPPWSMPYVNTVHQNLRGLPEGGHRQTQSLSSQPL